MYDVGEMRNPVQLVAINKETVNGYTKDTETVLGEFYAAAEQASMKEIWESKAAGYESIVNFTMRTPKKIAIEPGLYVKWQGMLYRIIQVKPHFAHKGMNVIKTTKKGA